MFVIVVKPCVLLLLNPMEDRCISNKYSRYKSLYYYYSEFIHIIK